ncbi:hypothetical protein U0C82_12045 [Fulvimarina sp. 2208YS6-2-32]|uniref:Uncharacterized protein n=1 Tax=Fulvimarina uroteuthidis TaxID=3098149 RepID=A0ABU5I3T4_9HYPH|nr:hypothetical protein [Fulvimarina sp. 2208YS6-2-32]MDY8109871.1 hypothetical protein [Fulvimarina sp. 2208YS6-2-32]
MPLAEIMGYVAACVTGLIVVMRLVDTYFAERHKGRKAAQDQTRAAEVAVFQPTADRYPRATIEQLIGEIHAKVAEIHRIVLTEDQERRENERRKLQSDLEELETLRQKDRRRT